MTLLALLFSAANLMGQTHILKPTDFEPLTSLPWKNPNATLESTLDAIFREPDPQIRYPVLAEYLRTIPAGQLGKAFDICINLESVQTPDQLVYLFLEIWARRDPAACWKRTEGLFEIVGIEDGWIDHREWDETIAVQDISAIRASRFWLRSDSLKSFPLGVEKSSLPGKERLQLLREFADKWFEAFGSWPGNPSEPKIRYPADDQGVIDAFSIPADQLFQFGMIKMNGGAGETITLIDRDHGPAFEVAERRWLEANPAEAPEIVKKMRDAKWQPEESRMDFYSPWVGLLLLWVKLDQAAMTQWVESLDSKKDADVSAAVAGKALLLSRVTPEIRARWLDEAKSPDPDGESWLISEWAAWDPKAGFDAAVATNLKAAAATNRKGQGPTPNCDTINDAAQSATRGPFPNVMNNRGFGHDVIKSFDPGVLPVEFRKSMMDQWDMILEDWGTIDIGEAARYGVYFLSRVDPEGRDELIKYFSGGNEVNSLGMPLRTISALRVWAVVRPKEMKEWIDTLKDPEMQKALTWLLNHPWGNEAKTVKE